MLITQLEEFLKNTKKGTFLKKERLPGIRGN